MAGGICLLGILGVLGGLPVPAPADPVCPPEQSVEPIVLCGSNTIIGSQPAQVRVRITAESEVAGPEYLPGTEPPQASPFMAALIKEDGARGRYALLGSFNEDHRGFFNDHRSASFPDSPDGVPLLPAGEYTLYLITQPGVESVFKLTLYDPSGPRPGITEFRPSRSAKLDWRTPANTFHIGPDGKAIYSAGTEFEYAPGQQSFGFFSSSVKGPVIAHLDNTCHYDDRPEGDFPYWPGCPTLNDAGNFNVIWGPYVLVQGNRIDYEQPWYIRYPWSTDSDHGVNAIGIWRAAAAADASHTALAWFLTLDN